MVRSVGRLALALPAAALALASAAPVALAHGIAPDPPTLPDTLLAWSFDPTIVVPLAIAAALYLAAVRSVDRAHPAAPVPRVRTAAFLAGLVAIEIALQSPIEHYDTTLFSVHMLQHMILTLVAAPLLALGAPITLLLRAVRPEVRTGFVLPILHSRLIRVVSFPVVSWIAFTAVMWGTHFSPWFDLALDDPFVHQLEHAAFLATALLFWWPVVGLDPSPWRMPHPVRALYTFLQMPQNTFLSLAIFSASEPLYEHYATLERTWGPTPLSDQQAAGALMWVGGDMTFVVALVLVAMAWMRAEERGSAAADARIEREEAAIRARARSLSASRSGSEAEAAPGYGSGEASSSR